MRIIFNNAAVILVLALILTAIDGLSQSRQLAKEFTNSIGMKMLRIEAGSFTRGETNPTPKLLQGPSFIEEGDWDERPVHQVKISRSFYISEMPITIEQYKQFRKEYTGIDLFEPYASGISWNDAVEFCKWLSKKEGKEYRVPTEAEWEYAARAGTKSLFWSGDQPPSQDAPNPWGLKDIAFGVPEWCYDWHGTYPDEDQVDPVGRAQGIARVVRDGGIQMRPRRDQRSKTLGFKASNFLDIPPYHHRSANRASMLPGVPSPETTSGAAPLSHFIGFRVVEAPLPATPPLPAEQPFTLDCVLPATAGTDHGPDMSKPYFKSRPILPIPPENDQGGGIEAVGMHPGIMAHLHSGGIVVAPNGDLLQISFSAATRNTEFDPNTTMVVTRLRRGAAQWDMPELFYDIADINDQSALLWNDNGKIWYFGGGRYFGDVRFKYATSTDSGGTWSELRLPLITEQKEYVEAQPISSAFRGGDGTIYFGTDGRGPTSLLWASRDEGKTWYDTGGRTAGRHTLFVLLKDGRILGMGGKERDIDGYMPKTYSSDWGKTWSTPTKTPFPAMGSNQRPTTILLKSGRLFFASDFQEVRKKDLPSADFKERGSFVALSDDGGETWHIKKLEMALPHETRQIPNVRKDWEGGDHDYSTIGYSAAVQSPNGVIHLMTSMNHPSMHFELNEAWILSGEKGEINHRVAGSSSKVKKNEKRYPDGKIKATWSGRIGANGDYVRHGTETWFYPNGKKKYEVTYQDGRKTGKESFWDPKGNVNWNWDHRGDGTSIWTQYWANGQKKIESSWRNFKADGLATHWDKNGKVIRSVTFKEGAVSEIK